MPSSRPVEEVAREIVGECGHDRLSFPQPRCRACKTGKAIASALRAAVDAERAEASEMRAAMERMEAGIRAEIALAPSPEDFDLGGRFDYETENVGDMETKALADAALQRAYRLKALLPRGVDVDERKQGRDL
jgi:hypothetical protein